MQKFLRYLRIAFSATCFIVAVLLIVLWVRSYWWGDTLRGPISETQRLLIGSLNGAVQFRLDDQKWSASDSLRQWEYTTISVAALDKDLEEINAMQAKQGSGQIQKQYFTWRVGWRDDTFFLGYWLPMLLTGGFAAAFGIRRPYRLNFSLRTLLIATTLVAVVLGLIVWVAR